MVATTQVEDGKWYAVAFGGAPFLEECCDCGLVHRTRFKMENGRFWVQYTRDPKLTRRARARAAIAKTKPARARKRR